ncbi:MAG: T9SS type A sorting domain-containing protein [Bacteroidota bacterium]|nr:T9SS type A sorting domain-containing protein [Bacteroidota bacterium]
MKRTLRFCNSFSKFFIALWVLTFSAQAQVANSTCYQCHSTNISLKKTITLTNGTQEFVPLYVDSTKYKVSKHSFLLCVQCHTDITDANKLSHLLTKQYGGWARFSAKNDTVIATKEKTRNYTTVAALSCNKNGCHATQAAFDSSTHHLTYKQKHASVRSVNGESVGEAYVNNDCNRCHTTCATCHFKATVKQFTAGDILTIWDSLQIKGDGAEPLKTQSNDLTQYQMDWTTNVESHTFLNGDSLRANNDVCQSCHIGYYKPPMNGFLSLESPFPKAYGTNIRRHPQLQEGIQSAVHKNLKCANCHTDVHSVPGTRKVDWQTEGDVICQKCHVGQGHSTFGAYAQHKTVDCISCHFRGFVKTSGQVGHDVWRLENKPTGRVRPLAMKYNEAVSWYPHNIEKPNKTTSCANKCHYQGNLIGATLNPTNVISTENVPKKFALDQNYPNPFNPSTVIRFDLPVSSKVTLTVYDALGRTVTRLIDDMQLKAGSHAIPFNANRLASGIYLYKIETGFNSTTKKMILLR